MIWVAAAIAASAVTGVVSILDSHLITRRMPSFRAFLAPLGVLIGGVGIIVMILNPLPGGTGTAALSAAIASGMMRVGGALPMLYTMRSEEVSRIIPVVNTYPIFVALMAVPVLGEVIGLREWTAILLTVGGAVLVSAHRGSDGQGVRLRRSFAVLVASAVLFGGANIASKYAMEQISFWSMYGITALCLGASFLLLSFRPSVLREIRRMPQRGRALALLALNECTAIVGFVLSFWAIAQGPVSLVSTILSTRPAFVFVFAAGLSRFFPSVLQERLTRGVILVKAASIALIIGGVTLLITGG